MDMINPVSIVQAIIDLALKIKKEVDTYRHNGEDCRRIGELVATVREVAESLRKTMEEEGGALLGGPLKALKQTLERALGVVTACQSKNTVLRANAIANKLRRVCEDVSQNLSVVLLATSAYNKSKLDDIKRIVAPLRDDVAYNTSKLDDIKRIVAPLRADVAYNTSKLDDIKRIVESLRADVAYNNLMLAKIMEIVAPLPDLQQQVARLVEMLESYNDSTDDDASYYENKSTRETKKTDDVASYCQNGSTRETKKTDDIARYTAYSSSHAYPSYHDYKAQTYDGYQQGAQRQYYGAAAGSLGGGATAQDFTTNVQPVVHHSAAAANVAASGSHITTVSSSRDYQQPNEYYGLYYGRVPY